MTWEVEQKKVRGVAQPLPRTVEVGGGPSLLRTIEAEGVYVRFDKTQYDARAGKEIHGKLYESPEEAIEEIGARTVERVLRDGEHVPVAVTIALPKWVEE